MVMGSKVKVTEITFSAEAYRSVVGHQRLSISDWYFCCTSQRSNGVVTFSVLHISPCRTVDAADYIVFIS